MNSPRSPSARFVLPNATLGKVIATGCYGVVHEVFCYGMKFAGKKIQDVLKPGIYNEKIFEECETLMNLRHPRIVQFIGVLGERVGESLTIVMEYLPTTLSAAITEHKHFPEEITYSILEDVSLGICFIHGQTPAVIHRDLTANNVLLDDNMRAKISDLGVAKILDLTPGKRLQMSRTPGAMVYMPPEARRESPDYVTDIDIFSFGVLTIHILCGDCPHIPYEYPKDPQGDIWQDYLQTIQQTQPSALKLLKKCLSRPSERPDAMEALEMVRDERAKIQVHHGPKMVMIKKTQMLLEQMQQMKNDRQKELETKQLNQQIETLEKEKAELQTERDKLKMTKEKLESLCNIKSEQIESKDNHLQQKEKELALKEKELELEKSCADELKKSLAQEESKRKTSIQKVEQRRERAELERDDAWLQLSSGEQIHLLHTHGLLRWETVHQRATISMTASQYTIIGYKLYFGGGHTDFERLPERKQVFELDTDTNIRDNPIRRLDPDCPLGHFGMGNIEGKLVAVGGRSIEDRSLSNKVHVYENSLDGTSTWSDHLIPCLSVPRARVCVISQTEDESSACIAACGGRVLSESKSEEMSTSMVEVYHSGSPHWVTVTSLPAHRAALRVTVLHKTAYLMGGYGQDMAQPSAKDCMSIVMDKLFSASDESQALWKTLRSLPTVNSAPGHLCGTLLAIGGSGERPKPVLAFNPNMQEWVHVANLPKTISSATAAALPNGKLIIFGGWERANARNKDIFIAQVAGKMF